MKYIKIELSCGHKRFSDVMSTIQNVKPGQDRYCKECFENKIVSKVNITDETEVFA